MWNNLKGLLTSLKNGLYLFAKAARGEYADESESISEFRAEFFKEKTKEDDKKNLRQDQKNIRNDARKSLNKIVLR